MIPFDLNYIDPECTSTQDFEQRIVSGYIAGLAYNDICRMLGGRYPDCKIQEEAPFAHAFFMKLFGVAV